MGALEDLALEEDHALIRRLVRFLRLSLHEVQLIHHVAQVIPDARVGVGLVGHRPGPGIGEGGDGWIGGLAADRERGEYEGG